MKNEKKFEVKARVTFEVYRNGDFRILAIMPFGRHNLELNKYGNCSITGDLAFLDVGKEYTFILKEGKPSKYGMSYIVEDVPSMKLKNLKDLTYDEKFEILMQCTSSERIAKSILEAYPNYIDMVVENGADCIDTKKIAGVGKTYNNAYTRELISKYKYYILCKNEELKQYNLTIGEAKKLFNAHKDTQDIVNHVKENPYYELINVCDRNIFYVDNILKEEYYDSDIRAEAFILDVLKKNELDGNTRLNGSILNAILKDRTSEYKAFSNLRSKLKTVATNSFYIYFDEDSHDLSIMATYMAECNVAQFVMDKSAENPLIKDFDTEKYRGTDIKLTDEQLKAVDNFNKYQFSLLAGSAGCVDKDTEFFNGKEWKKISDYNENDMVLQYNTKELKTELVKPYTYIKLPEVEWVLIKNKYGKIIQQLSPDHIATIFDTKTGDVIDCNIIKAISKFDKNKIEKHRYYFLGDNNATDLTEVEYIDYMEKGYKYCFKVPSEHLVLRKNSYTFITHNCGKTTSVKSIIQYCDDNHLTYTLLAPTGAASIILSEATGRPASTIHLKCLKDQSITTDVLIVDEMSMCDLFTFNMMIHCIDNPNIRVVLVGDPSQLLPVGAGCVYADMLNSKKLPMTNLTQVFRYDDDSMLYMATNSRKGRFCLDDDMFTHEDNIYRSSDTYKFIEIEDNDDIEDNILNTTVGQYLNLVKKGIRPKNILLLSAYNVGKCGVNNLNKILQLEINPPTDGKKTIERDKDTSFIVGDRVINTKNDYKALTPDNYEVISASEGKITEDDIKDTEILMNGQRGVVVDIIDGGKAMVCKFDEKLIVITKKKIKNIKLAYAITDHKSQGSSADYVISVISPTQKRLLTRNLLYVIQTRAKKGQIDIGTIGAMKTALSIDGVELRDTWLFTLLTSQNPSV